MTRAWLAGPVLVLLLAVVAVPQGVACTSTYGPFQGLRFVAKEGEAVLVDLPTSLQVGPNGLCGHQGPPRLSFDGRFAAWLQGDGLHVVDVDTGKEAVHPRGVLTEGHVAFLEDGGPRATLLDLAAGTSQVVEAPAGQSFVASFEGAVVARGLDPLGGPTNVSVLDPVAGTWLLHMAELPQGDSDPRAGSKDWIVFGHAESMRVLRAADGAVLPLPQAGSPQAFASGVAGDRLYLHATKPMDWSSSATTHWSVRLPAGDDRRDGDALPPVGPRDGRTVEFVLQSTSTDTGSTTTDPATTTSGLVGLDGAPDGEAGDVEAGEGDGGDGPLRDVSLPGPPLAWLVALVLAAGVLLARRRLT